VHDNYVGPGEGLYDSRQVRNTPIRGYLHLTLFAWSERQKSKWAHAGFWAGGLGLPCPAGGCQWGLKIPT
jgi:hypothetical protein